MGEIKAAFEELQLQQESDYQVMRRLLERYRNGDAALDEKISILKDLEIYVHQVSLLSVAASSKRVVMPC